MHIKVSPDTFNMLGVFNGRDQVIKNTQNIVNTIEKMKLG